MSGGHFDYTQRHIEQIADELDSAIATNVMGYSEVTINEFEKGVELLRKAYIYAQRIDWLMSGDDSEKTFHERLWDDLVTAELVEE